MTESGAIYVGLLGLAASLPWAGCLGLGCLAGRCLQLQAGSQARDEASPQLGEAERKKFMSVAARLSFLGGDRPDC